MNLCFVRLEDGALYATGPQQDIPGGPIGYVLRDDAAEMVVSVGGEVVERTIEEAVAFCQEKGYVLWIKKAGGGMMYVPETIPETPGETVRIEGDHRQAALDASERMSGQG